MELIIKFKIKIDEWWSRPRDLINYFFEVKDTWRLFGSNSKQHMDWYFCWNDYTNCWMLTPSWIVWTIAEFGHMVIEIEFYCWCTKDLFPAEHRSVMERRFLTLDFFLIVFLDSGFGTGNSSFFFYLNYINFQFLFNTGFFFKK